MHPNINYRTLLIMLPIALVTMCNTTGVYVFHPDNVRLFSNASLVTLTFALACSMIPEQDNRIWRLFGCAISYFTAFIIVKTCGTQSVSPGIVAAFLAPFAASVPSPANTGKPSLGESALNYVLAGFFVLVFTLVLTIPVWAILHYAISGIRYALFSITSADFFDFIYGTLYQTAQAFGSGDRILEIFEAAPAFRNTNGIYTGTLLCFFSVLTGIYAAVALWEGSHGKYFTSLLFLLALSSGSTSMSITLLMLTLIWLYPSLFALYLIISSVIYMVTCNVKFDVLINNAESFYRPDIVLADIDIADPSFATIGIAVFCASMALAYTLIRLQGAYTETMSKGMAALKAIGRELSNKNVIREESLRALEFLKIMGGFNNVIWVGPTDDRALKLKIVTENSVNTGSLSLIGCKMKLDPETMICDIEMEKNAGIVREQLLIYAEALSLDVVTEYREIEPYALENSRFKGLFSSQEEIYALDTN